MGAVPKRLQAWCCRERCSPDQEQPTASCGCLLIGAAYKRLQGWCRNSDAVQVSQRCLPDMRCLIDPACKDTDLTDEHRLNEETNERQKGLQKSHLLGLSLLRP